MAEVGVNPGRAAAAGTSAAAAAEGFKGLAESFRTMVGIAEKASGKDPGAAGTRSRPRGRRRPLRTSGSPSRAASAGTAPPGTGNRPGTTNMEGWWSTVDMPDAGGHDAGDQPLPSPVRLGATRLLFRDAAVKAIPDDPRLGVSVDDLPASLRYGDHVKNIAGIPAGAARDQAREDMLRIVKANPGTAEAYSEFEKAYLAWKGDASGKDHAGGGPKG